MDARRLLLSAVLRVAERREYRLTEAVWRVRPGMGIVVREEAVSGQPEGRRVCRLWACRWSGWETGMEECLWVSGRASIGLSRGLNTAPQPAWHERQTGLWGGISSLTRLLVLRVLMLGRCGAEVCYSQLEDGGRWVRLG